MVKSYNFSGAFETLLDPSVFSAFSFNKLIADENEKIYGYLNDSTKLQAVIDVPGLMPATTNTYNQFFGVMCFFELLSRSGNFSLIDTDLRDAISVLLRTRSDFYTTAAERESFIDEIAELLFTNFCQVNEIKNFECWNTFNNIFIDLDHLDCWFTNKDMRVEAYEKMHSLTNGGLNEHVKFISASRCIYVKEHFAEFREITGDLLYQKQQRY